MRGISLNKPVVEKQNTGISINTPHPSISIPRELGQTELGNSKYDSQILTEENIPNLNEIRAQSQTTADKLGNGLVTMGTSAFTSALNSTVGLAYGALDALATQDPSKLWDNEISRPLMEITEAVKQSNPFYYTRAEQDSHNPLKGVIPGTEGSGNFWFDKVLGNSGYTLGAMAVGMGMGKMLQLGKAVALGEEAASAYQGVIEGKITSALTKQGQIDLAKQTLIAGMMGAGESATEAMSTYDEMRDKLIKLRASGDPNYAHLTDQRIDELSKDAGNTNFLISLPVTGALDMMLLGKWINPGSKAAVVEYNKIAQQAVKEGAETGATQWVDATLKNPTWKRALLNGSENFIGNVFKEGGQEMSQHAANLVSQEFVDAHGVKNMDWFNSITNGLAKGITETVTTKEGWEEGLIGGITGGLFGGGAKSERLAREEATKAKVDALNNFKWDELNDRAKSFVSANEALRQSESALQSGDLFEAKNKEHQAFVDFIDPLIKNGATDILKEKLQMLKQAPTEEFNKQFGFKEGSDQTKQYEVVDKLIQKVDRAEQLHDNMTRLFGNKFKNPKLNHLNSILINRAYRAASVLDDIDEREKKVTEEIKKLGADSILLDRQAALSVDEMIDPILEKDLKEIGEKTDYAKKRKELKAEYRKKYNESIEKLTSVLPVNAPEIKELLADLNRLAERRENFIQYYNELQDPKKATDRLIKEGMLQAAIDEASKPKQVSSKEDADEVIGKNEENRQNEFTNHLGETTDLAKHSDEGLTEVENSLKDELTNPNITAEERANKEAHLRAIQLEQERRYNGDKMLEDLRTRYANARTVDEKHAIAEEALEKGFSIHQVKHEQELKKTALAEEQASKVNEMLKRNEYLNEQFKGEKEFSYTVLLNTIHPDNPAYQNVLNEIIANSDDFQKDITVVFKKVDQKNHKLKDNPNLEMQNSNMGLHLAYKGKEFAFIPFYDMFVDKQTGKAVPIATMTEDQFRQYFGQGHNKNFADFQRTYINAKSFYEELNRRYKNGENSISNEDLLKLCSFSLSSGSFDYVPYGEAFPSLSEFPTLKDSSGMPVIADTGFGKQIETQDGEKYHQTFSKEVFTSTLADTGLVITVNPKYKQAFDYLNTIKKKGLYNRYLALVEQAGGPVTVDGKQYQWVGLSPTQDHVNMNERIQLAQSYNPEVTRKMTKEERDEISKNLNRDLFIVFGTLSGYSERFGVSLHANFTTKGTTVRIYNKTTGEKIYLNVPESKDFKSFVANLEEARKLKPELAGTTPFTEQSFKFNVDEKNFLIPIEEQLGVTVKPNNKQKSVVIHYQASTNWNTPSVKVEPKTQTIKGNLVEQGTKIELEIVGDSGKEFLLTVDRKGNIGLFSEKQSDGSYKSGDPASKEDIIKLYKKYVPTNTILIIQKWVASFTGSWAASETKEGKNNIEAEKELKKVLNSNITTQTTTKSKDEQAKDDALSFLKAQSVPKEVVDSIQAEVDNTSKPNESATAKTNSTDAKKADIERRRQEELTTVGEGLTYIPEAEAYAYIKNDGSTGYVTEEQILTLEPRINAKYDAELAALNNTTKPNESTEVSSADKLLALTNEKLASIEEKKPSSKPTRGNSSTSTNDRGVYSGSEVFTPEQTIQLEEAFKTLRSILPEGIKAEEMSHLEARLRSGLITYGQFRNNVIKLYSLAEAGTEYHEAFHAVFRSLLSPQEREELYKQAKAEFYERRINFNKAFGEFLKLNPEAEELSPEEQHKLFLEEYMANRMKEYALNRKANTPTSWIGKLWDKIKRLFKFFTDPKHKNTLDYTFARIYSGKFKNAKINRFSDSYTLDPAHSRISAGENNGERVFLTQPEQVQFVNTVKAEVLDLLERNAGGNVNIHDLIMKSMDRLGKVFDVNSSAFDAIFEGDDVSTMKKINRLDYVFNKDRSQFIEHVKAELLKFAIDEQDMFEDAEAQVVSPERAYDRNQEQVGGFGSLSKAVKSYISTVTYETTLGDLLGLKDGSLNEPVRVSCNPKEVYNGLAKLCANQPSKSKVLEIMGSQIKYKGEVGKFVAQFFADTGLSVNEDGTIDVSGVDYLTDKDRLIQSVAEAFNLVKIDYRHISINPEDNNTLSNTILATLRDAETAQLAKWNQNFLTSKTTGIAKGQIIDKFIEILSETRKIPYDERELNDLVDTLSSALSKSSIMLSKGYIEYLILSNPNLVKTKGQERLVDNFSVSVESELKDTIENLKGISISLKTEDSSAKSLNGWTNPYLRGEIGESDKGAVTRLLELAKDNAVFDDSVAPTSFINSDGKPVYSFQKSTFNTEKVREIASSESYTSEGIEDKIKRNPIHKFLRNNILLSDAKFQAIRNSLKISRIDGVRERSLEKVNNKVKGKQNGRETTGVVYGDFNSREFLVVMYNLFLDKRKVMGADGKIHTVHPTFISVMGESNTGDTVDLPMRNYIDEKGELNEQFVEDMFNELVREHTRIKDVKSKTVFKDNIVNFNSFENRGEQFWSDNKILLDHIAKITGNPELINQLIAAESLDSFKEDLKKGIVSYYNQDFQDHIDLLIKNGIITKAADGKLISVLLSEEYAKSLDPNDRNRIFDGGDLEKNIKTFYFSDLVNRLAINQLISEDPALGLKDGDDKVKRDKGNNASGSNTEFALSDSNSPLRHIIFGKDIKGKFKDPADPDIDAQGYGSVSLFRDIYTSLGRMTNRGQEIYDKLEEGEKLTYEEIEYLKEHNIMANSLKMVYYDGTTYIKLSISLLSKEHTSYKDKNGNWVAQRGMEWKHDLREKMEGSNVHLAGPPSMSKKMIVNPVMMDDSNFLESIKEDNVQPLDRRFFRLQQENPSNKKTIVDPTQMLQLLAAEQNDATEVTIDGKTRTIGEVKNEFTRLLGERTKVAATPVMAYISKLKADGTRNVDLAQFSKMFRKALESTGASEKLLDFTELDSSGQPIYDWNDQAVVQKFEEMYTAHFNTAMSHKIPGYKTTAQSDFGHNIIYDKATGRIVPRYEYLSNPEKYHGEEYGSRRLQIREDGFAEVILPAHFKELFNLKAGQQIPEEIAKIFAVRIPSQDKHSSVPCVIVDFLPAHMGSNIVVPAEFIHLTGSDFDIDSFYCHRFDHYVDKEGNIKVYGNTQDSKWKQFKEWHKVNNSLLKELVEEQLGKDDAFSKASLEYRKFQASEAFTSAKEELGEIEDLSETLFDGTSDYSHISDEQSELLAKRPELEKIINTKFKLQREVEKLKDAAVTRALSQLELPSTEEEYKTNPIPTLGEINNKLLHCKMALHSNEYTMSKQANGKAIVKTAATLDVINQALKKFAVQTGWGDASNIGKKYNSSSLNGVLKGFSSSKSGSNAIGAAVNNSQFFSVISKYGLTREGIDKLPIHLSIGDKVVQIGKLGHTYFTALGNRIMDELSSQTSSMTDNLKHNYNERLGLTLQSLGPVGIGSMHGIDFYPLIQILNSEFVAQYEKLGAAQNIQGIDERGNSPFALKQEYLNSIAKRIADIDPKAFKEIHGDVSKDIPAKGFTLTDKELDDITEKGNATRDFAVGSVEEKQKLLDSRDAAYMVACYKALLTYKQLVEINEIANNFNKVVKLTKGLHSSGDNSTSFSADEDTFDALAKMNIQAYYHQGEFKLGYIDPEAKPTYDFLPVIRAEHGIMANLKLAYDKQQLAKQAFVSQTNYAKEIRDEVANTFTERSSATNRRKAMSRFRRQFEAHLNVMALRQMLKNSGKTMSELTSLLYGNEGVVNQIQEFVKRNPSFRNNLFLNKLVLNVSKSGMNEVSINTFSKSNSEFEDQIGDAFDALYDNPEGRELQKVLVDYLIAKDAAMFKGGSFIKYVPAAFFKNLSDIRKEILPKLNSIDNEAFKKYFGKDATQLKQEFLSLFLRHRDQFKVTKKIKRGDLMNKEGEFHSFVKEEGNELHFNVFEKGYKANQLDTLFDKHIEDKSSARVFPRYFYLNSRKAEGGSTNTLYELQSINDIPLDKTTANYGTKATYKEVSQLGNFDGVTSIGKTVEEAEALQNISKDNVDSYKALQAASISEGDPMNDVKDALAALSNTSLESNQSKPINIYAGTNENADLSNFATRPFSHGGFTYNNIEQAFQHAKWIGFGIPFGVRNNSGLGIEKQSKIKEAINEQINKIMAAKSGAEAKKLGGDKTIIPDSYSKQLLSEWDSNSSRIMKELLKASFEQNPKALERLLNTGNTELTHTQDKGKWGKEFPKLLMEVRDELRKTNSTTSVANSTTSTKEALTNVHPEDGMVTSRKEMIKAVVSKMREDQESTSDIVLTMAKMTEMTDEELTKEYIKRCNTEK